MQPVGENHTILNNEVCVCACTNGEDVNQSIEDDGHNLGLLDDQQVTEGLQHPGLHQVRNLLNGPSCGEVSDGPHSLLLGLVLALRAEEGRG